MKSLSLPIDGSIYFLVDSQHHRCKISGPAVGAAAGSKGKTCLNISICTASPVWWTPVLCNAALALSSAPPVLCNVTPSLSGAPPVICNATPVLYDAPPVLRNATLVLIKAMQFAIMSLDFLKHRNFKMLTP